VPNAGMMERSPSVPAPEPGTPVALDKAMQVTGQVAAGLGVRQVVADPPRKRL
jgi:hypothetical protein